MNFPAEKEDVIVKRVTEDLHVRHARALSRSRPIPAGEGFPGQVWGFFIAAPTGVGDPAEGDMVFVEKPQASLASPSAIQQAYLVVAEVLRARVTKV